MPLLRHALLILLATPLPCGAANSRPTIRPGPLTSSITGVSDLEIVVVCVKQCVQ
jgi:hypothetical protein